MLESAAVLTGCLSDPAALVAAMRLAPTALALTLALQRLLPPKLHLEVLSGWAVLLRAGVFVACAFFIGALQSLTTPCAEETWFGHWELTHACVGRTCAPQTTCRTF